MLASLKHQRLALEVHVPSHEVYSLLGMGNLSTVSEGNKGSQERMGQLSFLPEVPLKVGGKRVISSP